MVLRSREDGIDVTEIMDAPPDLQTTLINKFQMVVKKAALETEKKTRVE